MPTPNLPAQVVAMLASQSTREHHAFWHYVRSNWSAMDAQERTFWTGRGWDPPRQASEPGAGIDFLAMHRDMIEMVNDMLADLADPEYPEVRGWAPIPWDPQDADWPMPPVYPGAPPWAKDPAATAFYRNEVERKFENNDWLAQESVTLDSLGSEIENGIHNWLHMHWAARPWLTNTQTQDRNDPRNDYLGDTYSSHVNKAFWKLHGWIDDRIGQWAAAAPDRVVDFSEAWTGPGMQHERHMVAHAAAMGHATVINFTGKAMEFSRDFFARVTAPALPAAESSR